MAGLFSIAPRRPIGACQPPLFNTTVTGSSHRFNRDLLSCGH